MRLTGVCALLAGFWLSAVASSAQGAKADPVRAAIEKQNAAFAAAFNRGDMSALAAAYAEDAIAFPPDGEMVRGRSAIEGLWKGVRDAGGKAIALNTIDVHSSGSLAAETGTAVLKLQPPNGAEQSQSVKYVVVWKRQPNGTWKLYRDIWNGMPAPTK
jgi:ketosteroid isomerase-like protein